MAGSWRVVERPGRDILGEGLFWSARAGALFWTDILGRRLSRLELATGDVCQWDMPEYIGWIIERARGGFVVGLQSGFHRLTLDPLALEPLHDPEPDLPANRLNDAKADGHGNIWAGTMPVSCEGATGALYRLGANGRVTRADSGITIANGPAVSPDGQTLYHTDTRARTVWRFALGPDGIAGKTVHLAFGPGDNPDGMTCDADGGLWIAFYGAGTIRRFAADGQETARIGLPTPQLTNVCFAGDALDRLFVTSAGDGRPDDPLAGALFEVDGHGCRGLAPHLYAG